MQRRPSHPDSWAERPWLLTLLITACTACAAGSTAWGALPPGETFRATLRNDFGSSGGCLYFSDGGHAHFPERGRWGEGAHCGRRLTDPHDPALWTFTPLGGDRYMITNGSSGSEECLGYEHGVSEGHPSRRTWGEGPYCGHPGGKEGLLHDRDAVWKITQLEGDRYVITSGSSGSEECLGFGADALSRYPGPLTWGNGGAFCGFLGGGSGLLANRQAVFQIEQAPVAFHPPQAWLDGYLIFQNNRHGHQRLHVGHNGDGRLYTDWGSDDAYRWKIIPTGDGSTYFLENTLHPQRLHVGHNGNGQLYAQWGSDDAYRWSFERLEGRFLLRNKRHSDQRLHVGHDGNGQLYAQWGDDSAYRWKVQVLADTNSAADDEFRFSAYYLTRRIRLQNRYYDNQALHVGHDGNGQLYAESQEDPSYFWHLEPSNTDGYYYLRNDLHFGQRLHVGHNGNGQLYAESGFDNAYLWKFEPGPQQTFTLRNKLHPDQRLHVGHDGNGQVYAGTGGDGPYRWDLQVVELPAAWSASSPLCEAQELLADHYRLCFYPWDNQLGPAHCTLERVPFDKFWSPLNRGDVPAGVSKHARSVGLHSCHYELRAKPRLFLYTNAGQLGETEIVEGSANLGTTHRRARSWLLHPHGHYGKNQYFCLYTEKDAGGRRHCVPFEPNAIKELSPDFNDQVRSIRSFPNWDCLKAKVWQHSRAQGQHAYIFTNQNLNALSPILTGPGLTFKSWDQLVSSFSFVQYPSWAYGCGGYVYGSGDP